MTAPIRFMFMEKPTRECVRRSTVLDFLDAAGPPTAVTDDADNTWLLHYSNNGITWYTNVKHMPKRITITYANGGTDSFAVPRDVPRL